MKAVSSRKNFDCSKKIFASFNFFSTEKAFKKLLQKNEIPLVSFLLNYFPSVCFLSKKKRIIKGKIQTKPGDPLKAIFLKFIFPFFFVNDLKKAFNKIHKWTCKKWFFLKYEIPVALDVISFNFWVQTAELFSLFTLDFAFQFMDINRQT